MASSQPSPPRPRAGSLPPPMPTVMPNAAGGRGTALSGAASKSYSVVIRHDHPEMRHVGTLALAWRLLAPATCAKTCIWHIKSAAMIMTGVLILNPPESLCSQARGWEEAAVLSEQQQMAVDLVSVACAQRPLPDNVRACDQLQLPTLCSTPPARRCVCCSPQSDGTLHVAGSP